MPGNSVDLLTINRGTVTAPAGCGKTHLIADALKRHADSKPVLVLTHTNAGVVALRNRLDREGVPSGAYRLSTIDGWAMRLISMFPAKSGHDPSILDLNYPDTDYPNIRNAAATLLASGHMTDILKSSYSRIFVDEYQDCSTRQHVLATWAAQVLPSAVLGDPLQAIFGFGSDGLADWNKDVLTYFPLAGELNTPWRWINAQAQPLGQWLLSIRTQLLQGQPVDLQQAPPGVDWVHLDGTDDHNLCLQAARVNPPGNTGSVLVLGDSKSPPSQQRIANQTPGAVTVEAVHLNDLVNFAHSFDPSSSNALQTLLDFAKNVMRNSGATAMMHRVSSLQNGTAHNPATDAENAALAFLAAPSFGAAASVLVEINKQSGVSVHRPAVLRACLRALQACASDGGSLLDAAVKMREQNRLIGRPLPKRAVGSTLLLKGLEAEVAVILNASDLNARHLYVAMTRGSKALVICSNTSTLQPS